MVDAPPTGHPASEDQDMKDAPAPPAPRPTRGKRPDWGQAALLLARGEAVAEVARRVGCSASYLARKRRTDAAFRARVEAGKGGDMAGLRHVVTKAIEQAVRDGNVRVVLWLADRLKLVAPVDGATPEGELRDLLRGLGPDELREFEALEDER
jgi:hypothetical protein